MHELQMQEICIQHKEVLRKGLSFELILQEFNEYPSPEIDYGKRMVIVSEYIHLEIRCGLVDKEWYSNEY